MRNKDCYEARLNEYMEANLHPETAATIGRIIFSSPIGSSEFAMSIILQMQLDPVRKDNELLRQEVPQLEATPLVQDYFTQRFQEAK